MSRRLFVGAVVLVSAAIALLAWAWATPALPAILCGWALGVAAVIAWEAEP